LFSFTIRRHPTSTLFPYTTLFRSHRAVAEVKLDVGGPALRVLVAQLLAEPEDAHEPLSRAGNVLVGQHGRDRRGHGGRLESRAIDRKSTRLNSSHVAISYAVFCLK